MSNRWRIFFNIMFVLQHSMDRVIKNCDYIQEPYGKRQSEHLKGSVGGMCLFVSKTF